MPTMPQTTDAKHGRPPLENAAGNDHFTPNDPELAALFATAGHSGPILATLLLGLAAHDDDPQMGKRGHMEDAVTWSALGPGDGRPVMANLLAVLCDVVEDVAPALLVIDSEICSIAHELTVHPGVSHEHMISLMSYARRPLNAPISAIGSTEAWIASAATLAAVWIVASAEGPEVADLIEDRVRDCKPFIHMAYLAKNATHASLEALGLAEGAPDWTLPGRAHVIVGDGAATQHSLGEANFTGDMRAAGVIDDVSPDAAILYTYREGDVAIQDQAAEAAFAYAHAALSSMLETDADSTNQLQGFTGALAGMAAEPVQWVLNELIAIAAFTIDTMQWARDIGPLPTTLQRLTDAGLLGPGQEQAAALWLAELAWWGAERARVRSGPISHDDLVEEARLALVLTVSVLSGLPHPLDGLTGYLDGLDDF